MSNGFRERPQQDRPCALTAHVAVRIAVEWAAAAVAREQTCLAEADPYLGCEQDVDAAYERQIAFTAGEALSREVDGDERGRAGGVHREAGTPKIEEVREPVRGDAQRAAGRSVGVDRRA